MPNHTWMLYGVGGTGTLIAEEALRRGQRPLLAGRSAERLKPVAERLGLEWVVADLNDATALAGALARVDLVVNAAGPFMATSAPMVRACLANSKHYLDISNEIPVFQSIRAHDLEARSRGVALMPGVGFGVVATDGLAQHVASQLPDTQELEIAIHPYTTGSNPGADKTRLEVIALGGLVRRDGQLTKVALGRDARRLRFPQGEQTIVPIPAGDLEAAFYNTGVPNITVYGVLALPRLLARAALPLAQRLIATPMIRRLLERRISARPGPVGVSTPAERTQPGRSYVWARATNRSGQAIEAWQETGEGYAFTAAAAVRAVEELFAHRPVGALTPAQAFGADFVLSVDGARRYAAV
jgi:short subunit dehydrogenase-like uncharacterized protein